MIISRWINSIFTYFVIMVDAAVLRIHVAPVGFEIDRVVMPVEERRADRVWLLVHPGDDKAEGYLRTIRNKLKGSGIDIQEKMHDRADLFDIIRATKEVIQHERENSVSVNLSSGSKIQAIGCMMACMMFDDESGIRPYYAEPEEYQQQGEPLSTGVRKVIEMPRYSLRIPSGMLIRTMQIIRHHKRIKKKNLLDSLLDAGIIMISDDPEKIPEPGTLVVNALEENRLVAGLARMDKSIIRPLVEWGFVEVTKMGRNRWVTLTKEGENAARFLPDG